MKNKWTKLLLLIGIGVSLFSCTPKQKDKTPDQDAGQNQRTSGTTQVSFTAINDFHGKVDDRGNQVGIAKLAKYLKEKKQNGNILINSGDMYQGSFVANYTKGSVVSDIFKDIGFDAYTVGNHEFDWGIEYIESNEQVLGEKMLGANVMKYPKTGSNWEKHPLFDDYKIVNLNKGTEDEIRVGIIGVIGKAQITSITSTFTKDLVFIDPTDVVINLAKELKTEKGCQIVVASYHAPEADERIVESKLSFDRRYVDAVFLAHDHQEVLYNVNGAPFIEGSSYGRMASNVTLEYNWASKKVTCLKSFNTRLVDQDLTYDPVALEKLNKVTQGENGTDRIAAQYVGFNDTKKTISTDEMSNFYEKVTALKAVELGYDFDYVMFNSSRESLVPGSFTYSQLFETHPFLNKLYIIECTGKDVEYESKYCYPYKVSTETFNSGNTYKVLVFDFNGFHIGINDNYEKYYNYFPSAFRANSAKPILIEEDNKALNCFEIALDWLKENQITTADIGQGSDFGL